MNLSSRAISSRTEPGATHFLEDQPSQDFSRRYALASGGAPGSMWDTPLYQLMSSTVRCVAADSSVRETVQVMRTSESAGVVVVEGGTPVGIVSEGDMLRILADTMVMYPAERLCIADFMATLPPRLRESDTLQDAVILAQSHDPGQIPIIDGAGRVVGLLTRERLAEARLSAVEQERDAVEARVSMRSRDLSKANRELQTLALQDSLLKIGNRRALEADVESTHLNAIRYGHPYALGLIDVDHFKRYNDHYGHCAGDRALIAVANCIKDSIRRGDRVYRYGGEELLVLMPEIAQSEALEAMSRLTSKLFQSCLEHSQSTFQRLTVSVGVSAFTPDKPGDKNTWQAVLEEADAFLYRAKAQGRNQVCGWTEKSAHSRPAQRSNSA